MWNKVVLFIVAVFLAGQITAAEAPITIPETAVFLIQSQDPLPTAEANETVFTYYSQQFDSHQLDGYSKAELIQLIRSNTLPPTQKKMTHFFVPFGPTVDWSSESADIESLGGVDNKSLLNDFKKYRVEFSKEMVNEINTNLESLSESDLRTFLSKKHGFLLMFGTRLEQAFKFLRIRPPYKLIQSFLNSLNNIFFQKSSQFVRSNTYGVPFFVTGGVGATLGRLVYDCIIAKTPLKKFINPNFGFYLGGSLGLGVSRVQIDKKTTWVLDLFFDFETLKRAFLPIFEAGAGGGIGFSMETRTLPEDGRKIFFSKASYKTALYAPVIGTTRSGPADLSTQHSLSAVFPMGSTFYETNSSRRYLHVILKTTDTDAEPRKIKVRDFFETLGDFFKIKNKPVAACLKFYH